MPLLVRCMRRVLVVMIVFVMSGFRVDTLEAAVWRGYDAELLVVEAPTNLEANKTGTVRLTFKNTGTKPWLATGSEYVSIYHWDPVQKLEISSSLRDSSWKNTKQPMRLPSFVGVGEQVVLVFPVRAPMVSGMASGDFILAAENAAWMKNSRFRVEVRVGSGTTPVAMTSAPKPSVAPAPRAQETPASVAFSPDATGALRARVTNNGGSAWSVEAGQDMRIAFQFMNTGDRPWGVEGAEAIRLVAITNAAQSRESVFFHPSWASKSVLTRLPSKVSLGSEGMFDTTLRAPEVPGSYRERFMLATVGGTLIPGSQIDLPITVNPGTGFIATDVSDLGNAVPEPAPASTDTLQNVPRGADDGLWKATPFLPGTQELELLGNGRQQITVGWRNVGSEAWSRVGVRLATSDPWVRASWLADATWMDGKPPEASIQAKNGEVAFHSFYVKAPPKRGTYLLTYRLFANGQAVLGGDVAVRVKVTSDGYIAPNETPRTTPAPTPSSPTLPPLVAQPLSGDPSTLPAEPMIRAGIYQPPHERLQVRATLIALDVLKGGVSVCSLTIGQTATISYVRSGSTYTLAGEGGCSGTSATPFQVKARDGISSMEIADFVRPSNWIFNASDNDFRGQLELRASNDGREVWVVNELPIEWYLKGIGETSNISPSEFQRTLLVAARTYAMYHVGRGTKHATQGFIVDATNDQIYRGYAQEQRSPNIVAAVDATRGQVVTYANKLAITPYFSRSDGRTRSWGEVWAGGSNYPWLIGVPVPQDQGRTLWGHGVGMSASGALSMANEGRRYEAILKHFYSGIEVLRAYR